MTFSTERVASQFALHKKGTGKHIYTDGKTIWSYGTHFPIATHLKNGDILFNNERYSNTTSRHQRKVLWATRFSDREFITCTTMELQNAINNPDSPIILTKEKEVDSFEQIMELMCKFFKSKGVKRFPKKQVSRFILKRMTAELI